MSEPKFNIGDRVMYTGYNPEYKLRPAKIYCVIRPEGGASWEYMVRFLKRHWIFWHKYELKKIWEGDLCSLRCIHCDSKFTPEAAYCIVCMKPGPVM